MNNAIKTAIIEELVKAMVLGSLDNTERALVKRIIRIETPMTLVDIEQIVAGVSEQIFLKEAA